MNQASTDVFLVEPARVDTILSALGEAFYHYPVMRYVLGAKENDFEAQYPDLIRLFVMARVLNNDPMFGIGNHARLEAAATVTLPEKSETPAALTAFRNTAWRALGPVARQRYDDFCDACSAFDVDLPHHHLNMLGTRINSQGKGYGKQLVRHVIKLADADDQSAGVSLSTENPDNVPFYESLGFVITGHAHVGPGLETWNFFRQQ